MEEDCSADLAAVVHVESQSSKRMSAEFTGLTLWGGGCLLTSRDCKKRPPYPSHVTTSPGPEIPTFHCG